jgi:hypothetical protein
MILKMDQPIDQNLDNREASCRGWVDWWQPPSRWPSPPIWKMEAPGRASNTICTSDKKSVLTGHAAPSLVPTLNKSSTMVLCQHQFHSLDPQKVLRIILPN